MRPDLAGPIADVATLRRATTLAHEAFRLHEHGQDPSGPLSQLARLAAKEPQEIECTFTGTFGSVGPASLVRPVLALVRSTVCVPPDQ